MDQEGSQSDLLRAKARKWGGLLSAIATCTNLALGGFLVFSWTHASDHVCDRQVPLWMLGSAATSLTIGCLFLLYTLFAFWSHLRRASYTPIEEEETLAGAAMPNAFLTLTGVFLGLVYLFRFAWLIFGTVELAQARACNPFIFRMGFIYVVIQWTLIGGFLLLALATCCILLCCAAVLAIG